jgi:hypothetical protein
MPRYYFHRHRQLNAFTCSFRCFGTEQATHSQRLRPIGVSTENGRYLVKLTMPLTGRLMPACLPALPPYSG